MFWAESTKTRGAVLSSFPVPQQWCQAGRGETNASAKPSQQQRNLPKRHMGNSAMTASPYTGKIHWRRPPRHPLKKGGPLPLPRRWRAVRRAALHLGHPGWNGTQDQTPPVAGSPWARYLLQPGKCLTEARRKAQDTDAQKELCMCPTMPPAPVTFCSVLAEKLRWGIQDVAGKATYAKV